MTPTSSMQVSIVESIIFQSFNVKPEKILIFLKNSKNNKISRMVQGNLENSLDLG